ncbi:MAG: hypothetical protein IJS30_05205 [Bacteroidales bacterium]|nr:hypothetical protein [Bacteroidales bacterium]
MEAIPRSTPDSALAALHAIPKKDIITIKDNARYALLYTQAQDRCGITVASDSLIKDAVRYYSHSSDQFRKFQSFYYLGQINQNAGSRDAAMDAYVKAENIHANSIPHNYLSALHFRKSSLYADSYDYSKAIEESEKALCEARLANDTSGIFQAILNIVEYNYYKWDDPFADHLLDSLALYYGDVSVEDKLDYQALWAELMSDTIPADQLVMHLDSVLAVYQDYSIQLPWNRIARIYVHAGYPEKALEALNHIPAEKFSALNYVVLSDVLDSLGQSAQALNAYRKYVDLSDSLDLILFRQDTRFIEERYANQIRRIRTNQSFAVTAVLLFILGWFIIARTMKIRKERTKLLEMFAELQEEHNSLQELLSKNNDVNNAAKEILGNRLRSISAFLTENRPDSLKNVASRLETLTADRKTLIETVGFIFAIYQPAFISMLMTYGLTPAEMGFCCMHVLGYRTSEIGDVINRAGYYNISSEIRNKLPISSQKLATWLTDKYRELEG